MKKIFTLLFLSTFLFTSCSKEGPQGPPGPAGPAGPPGEDGYGTVVDVVGSFNSGNEYSLLLDFNAEGIEVFESDAVLVYMKTGEDGTADGSPVEVFRMLPQTYFLEGGALQYNFDFTFFDLMIFLDGTVDLETLAAEYTNDRVFRVIVLPADFATSMDTSNMANVLKAMNVQEKDVKKASI